MSKECNTSEAVSIAPNIYWVGMHLKDDPFQCHPYLIENGNESILIDPGSMLEFDETVRKTKSIVDLSDIKYIILHHQDPDLAAAVPDIEKLIDRDDLLIVTHSRISVLVKHYLIKSSYYEIDKHDNVLVTSNGFRLDFLTTPYCHSPGAFVSYEPNSKTLFSGDIFGGIEESWDFYADETYFEKAKQFHQEYMPSKDIFNYALGKIEKLDINLIAPQHGSIIEKIYINKLIKDMKNLDCGLYIDEKYNRELIDTIKELQKKEQALKERNLLLSEQSKRAEIGEMIGNIAHQWRQPLAIINTSLAILKEKNRANILSKDEIAEKLDKMEKRVIYMSETIEDFMSYYSPDKEKTWFSINLAIEKALDIVNMQTANKRVMVTLLLNSQYMIYGLINEFIQVIVSILSNINDLIAINGLSDVSITIASYRDDTYTTVIISDNCGGINEENLNKIFDPYFTTKHKSMGTGLGLHIAKMIIEDNMRGLLSAKNIYENDKVVGAKFTIKVKMKIDKIKDISILLAEDETELREMLHEYLQLFFHRVYTAACGNEAYDIYKQKKPNIILTDINMPNLDGLDMIAKIRKQDKDTKIIVMSAHSEQEKLLNAIKLHLESYLIKPIKTDALKNVLLETVDLIRKTTNRIYVGDTMYWDNNTDRLWYNSKEIKLRKMENMLLKLLFSQPNHCFSAKDIFEYLHHDKEEKEFSTHSTTSLMKRIRTKLPNDIIHNVYGSGYKVVAL